MPAHTGRINGLVADLEAAHAECTALLKAADDAAATRAPAMVQTFEALQPPGEINKGAAIEKLDARRHLEQMRRALGTSTD